MIPADPARPAPAGTTPDPVTIVDLDPPGSATATAPVVRAGPRRLRRPILAVSIALVAVLSGSALFLSGYALGRRTASDPGTPPSDVAAFQPFWDTYHTIIDRYAGGPVDQGTLIQGAIRGMIASLDDPYSTYLTSKEYQASLEGISGQFEGIGAQITTRSTTGTDGCTPLGATCRLVITKPLDGSPALKAGLLAGDIVASVDGASLDGLTVDAAVARIRGPVGSVVTLVISRDGGAPLRFAITRGVVQTKEVDSRALAGGTVGYIRVGGFSDTAAADVVSDLRADVAAGQTKLILDLRGDPGGFVTAARTVASQFIGSGVIFWAQDATGNQTRTEVLGGGVATNPAIRLVVLIDGGTASASEIVAGALQDTKRATLVGQQSYGKGTVQEWQQLSGQDGAFKLTIARWLTPDKRWIHHVGLTPDVVVTLPNPVPAGTDPDLARALEVLGAPGTGS
jgi:carboxyl-terminal processing protease